MGMVQQQNFLFSGSVLDNIRLSRPEATVDEVRRPPARLGCLDMLEELPDGLETQVGERGAGLSVGQRQLVCFVRALLADPRIVVLDEATSSIDALTEARLQQALAILLRGRTSFVVAHRLSTIRGRRASSSCSTRAGSSSAAPIPNCWPRAGTTPLFTGNSFRSTRTGEVSL